MRTETYLRELTECIRESKRPIGLLLGAGCAKSLDGPNGQDLIPDTRGMTAVIEEKVLATNMSDSWKKILSQLDYDGERIPNIEDVLSQVRGLLRYAGDGEVRGLMRSDLSSLEKEICTCISNLVDVNLPDGPSGYHDLATWLGSIEREEPIEVFTTNYDLLIEQALEEFNIPYFDGFVGAYKPFFDTYTVANDGLPARWLRLWKIHGSVNWVSSKDDGVVKIWRSDEAGGERALIHPSHMKYDQSRKMPYLALIDRLQTFLHKARSVLFIVGYSFGDEHLNDVILQALQGSTSTAVFAFMYENLSSNQKAKELALRRSNLSLFARDAGVISAQIKEWSSREAESQPESDVVGARWAKSGNENRWSEEFSLGDFQEFGTFLRSVTGQEGQY